ncbi:MAG TPA: hypothetical protein VFQ39_09365 [Longimicrobium sp.]|nr:hypothetical protein [Longimicrobium sp.]
MSEDAAGDEVRERVLREMAAAFPAKERPQMMARLLDEIERLHQRNGIAVPGWVGRMKVRLETPPPE